MQRRYITVDVFTDRAFGGNPLGVVLDAGGLSIEQMQAIAREFNYSETTFVLPPADSAHDAQVRIFTVNRELPFAGHPNVGTAFVLATLAAKAAGTAAVRGGRRPRAGRDRDRSGQGRQHRIHRAAAAEADVASWCRTGSGLPLAVGWRRQDRPASTADHLGRAVVPGRRSRLPRGAAAGEARCSGVRKNLPVRRQRRRLLLYARRAGQRKAVRAAGADVSSRRQRTVRRPRDRQCDSGLRGAAGRCSTTSRTAN